MQDESTPPAVPPRDPPVTGPADPGPDLLSSGTGRPRRELRIWQRRRTRVVAGVLAVAATTLLLRSTVHPRPSTVDRPAPAGALSAPARPLPPFDGRPGRTTIPAPTRAGGQLTGALPPAGGGPDRAAAVRAVDLVLGRYCLDPRAYAYTLGSDEPARPETWRRVIVLLFLLERGGNTPSLRLQLSWTGQAYRWTGPDALLGGC